MRVRSHHRLRLSAALVIVGVLGTLAIEPAHGQVGDDATTFLGAEDVLEVVCIPEVITDNQPATCVVELTPDGPHLFAPSTDGPAVVAADSGREARSDECYPNGATRLVCTGLRLFTPGVHVLSFRPRGDSAPLDGVAQVQVVPDLSEPFHASLAADGQGAVVRGGRALRFEVLEGSDFADLDPAQGVFATVAPLADREGGRVVVLKEPGTAAAPSLALGDSAGLYLVSLCVGADPETCEELTGAFPVRVYQGSVRELVTGTTIKGADRINLVFAASGLGSRSRTVIHDLLMRDGLPRHVDSSGAAVAAGTDAVAGLRFGMFAMEPFRSNLQRFDLWLYDAPVYQPFSAFLAAVTDPETGIIDGFGLADAALMVVADEVGRRLGAESEAQDLVWAASADGVSREDLVFGAAWTWMNTAAGPLDAAPVLTHEFGHVLFDLRDEYLDPARAQRHGYPNCAPDQAEAEAWWGDLAGELDPFYTEWAAALQDNGLVPRLDPAALTVGFVEGGCYGGGEGAIRPTADSLMNSDLPVLGAVNRRHVESILALFTGLKIVASTDIRDAVVELSCTGGRQGGPVACSGALGAGYDASAGLDMRIGEGDPATCTVSGSPAMGQAIECSAPPWGSEEQIVRFSVAGQDRFVPSRFEWQPPPPTVLIRALAENLRSVDIEIEELGGRSVLDVELTVNGVVAWIRTLSASGTEPVTAISPGDTVCASVRTFPDSGNCIDAPAAPFDQVAIDDADHVAPPRQEGGGIPLAVIIAGALVVAVGAGVGIRAWWYRY